MEKGGTRMNVAILFIQTKIFSRFIFHRISYSLDTPGKSFKDTFHITTHLHGDDSQLILFIDPDQECLGIIMEDAPSLRPVSLHPSNSKVSVSRNKEEMIINKLLPDTLIHSSERVVFSSQVSSKCGSCIHH